MFSLELGHEVANLTCSCCGKPFQSVCGFIKKNDSAYSVYFAQLQTGHEKITVGLSVSIGEWFSDSKRAIKTREWCYFRVWPSEPGPGFEIRIEEPEESRHFESTFLGSPLSCADARARESLNDFFDIADFIIDNDPAVLSYLSGESVNITGRTCIHQ